MEKKYGGHANKGGVYQITNQVSGKVYIGSCKSFKVRAKQHLTALEKQKHHNKHLQRSWNKHETDAFLFEVIEVVNGDKIARTTCEQVYLDEQKGNWQGCYNISKKSVKKAGPWSHTPGETRKKHSEASMKMWQNPEHRQKVSKACSKAAKEQWSHPKSREKILKASQKASRKRKGTSWGSHSKEHKKRMSEVMKGNDWNKGRKHSKDVARKHRKNLAKYKASPKRLKNLRKALSKRVRVYKVDDPSFEQICESITKATELTGLSRSTIRRNLQGKQISRGIWQFTWANQESYSRV